MKRSHSSLAGGKRNQGRASALALTACALAGACGGDDAGRGAQAPDREPAVGWLDPEGELPVVGSLSVNPADGAVWMATNTGLFRVADDAPERVSGRLSTPEGDGTISAQLVVHFTGPDRLLGSGHPPPDETGLPEILGLIASDDAARTWAPVSELGRSDFHAIEVTAGRIVGALSGRSQILVSDDEGRTWTPRAAPRVLVDLAVDPAQPDRWAATTADGVYVSGDGGGSWRPVDPTPSSYLAWPEPDLLYRLDPGGPLMRSRDGGRRWEKVGSTGGEPRALTAADAETLFAALRDGTVKRSVDGGRTWNALLVPPG